MGFIATDLATMPVGPRYSWYLFLLEDTWQDELRNQLADNFMALAGEVGTDALVVRGANSQTFYSQVFYEYALKEAMDHGSRVLPAILVTDTPPHDIRSNEYALRSARIVLFPLAALGERPTQLTAFLAELSRTVRSDEAFEALRRLDRSSIQQRWSWITRYLDIKPNFLGFGVDLDAIIDDLWNRAPRRSA